MIKLIYGPSESKLPKMLKLRWISWKMGHGKWYVFGTYKAFGGSNNFFIICRDGIDLVEWRQLLSA
jgi:hypothetical protein